MGGPGALVPELRFVTYHDHPAHIDRAEAVVQDLIVMHGRKAHLIMSHGVPARTLSRATPITASATKPHGC